LHLQSRRHKVLTCHNDIIDGEPSDSAETVIEADKFSWDKVLDDDVEDENEEISN
jgi:hypothetical protein